MALVVREAPVAPVVPLPPAAAEVQVAQASTDIPLVSPRPTNSAAAGFIGRCGDPAPANTPAVATPADSAGPAPLRPPPLSSFHPVQRSRQ